MKNDYDFHNPSPMGGYSGYFVTRLTTFDFCDFYDFQVKARDFAKGHDKKGALFRPKNYILYKYNGKIW